MLRPNHKGLEDESSTPVAASLQPLFKILVDGNPPVLSFDIIHWYFLFALSSSQTTNSVAPGWTLYLLCVSGICKAPCVCGGVKCVCKHENTFCVCVCRPSGSRWLVDSWTNKVSRRGSVRGDAPEWRGWVWINWTETGVGAQVRLLITRPSFSLSLYMLMSHRMLHTNEEADEYHALATYRIRLQPSSMCKHVSTVAHMEVVWMCHSLALGLPELKSHTLRALSQRR